MNANQPSLLVIFALPYVVLLYWLLCELGSAGLWGEVFAAGGAVAMAFGLPRVAGGLA